MSENTYSLEYAKSGRSKCKKCKVSIDKGEIRLVVESPGTDFTTSMSYHPLCFTIPRKLNGTSATDFLSNIVVDSTGEILPDKLDELAEAIEAKPAAKNKDAEDSLLGPIKAAYENQVQGEEPPSKKPKNDLTDAVALYAKYHKLTTNALKDYLRYNREVLKGTKPFILFKVIDGELRGRLAPCPMCQGKLKLEESGVVLCSGHFDEDTKVRIPCAYTVATSAEAPRDAGPWYTEKPTPEQEAAMDAKPGDDGAAASSAVLDDSLLEQAAKIPWDVSNKKGVKEAAAALLELLQKNTSIALPEAKPLAKVGQTILANKTLTATEIIELLVKEYGTEETKQAKEELKKDATKKVVTVPANAGLFAAFSELSELYFKEGNRNAGITYGKVAGIVQTLEFEVTKDNAKGLSKGKTKLPGVGKSSSDKMYEFCDTGTMQKLEEKRADAA